MHRGASRPLVRPHRDAIYFHDEGGLGGARLPPQHAPLGRIGGQRLSSVSPGNIRGS